MKKNKLLTVIRVISKIIGIILMIVGGLTFIVGLIFRLIMGPVEPPQTDNVMMIGLGAILLLFQSIPFLMIFVVWLVMFNFQSIKYSEANGLEISSKYIFSGAARAYFPWTWVTVYKFVLRFMIPCFHGIIMLLKNEHNGTKLDRFRGYVYMLGILSMWALSFFLDLRLHQDEVRCHLLLNHCVCTCCLLS